MDDHIRMQLLSSNESGYDNSMDCNSESGSSSQSFSSFSYALQSSGLDPGVALQGSECSVPGYAEAQPQNSPASSLDSSKGRRVFNHGHYWGILAI